MRTRAAFCSQWSLSGRHVIIVSSSVLGRHVVGVVAVVDSSSVLGRHVVDAVAVVGSSSLSHLQLPGPRPRPPHLQPDLLLDLHARGEGRKHSILYINFGIRV